MSPELLNPESFGLMDSQRTKKSDCYALGMVMFEVLSGHVPFPGCKDVVVVHKVLGGERPGRLRGAKGLWFTDEIWEMMERCWSPQPEHRPGVEAVLECLERVSAVWHPPSPMVDDDVQVDPDDEPRTVTVDTRLFPRSVTDPRLVFEGKATWSSAPSRLPAVSPTVDSLVQGASDVITTRNTDASKASPPSQPSEKLDPEEFAGVIDQASWTIPLDEIWC